MKIALVGPEGSFVDRWREVLEGDGVPFEILDWQRSDVVERLRDFDALLCHFSHTDFASITFGLAFLRAAEARGLVVFPRTSTYAHFDDKVAQKYAFEAVDAPLVPTYVQYDEASALAFAEQARYPLVFKLRRGAGSSNVRLVRSRDEAVRLCRTAFGEGFASAPTYTGDARRKIRTLRGPGDVWRVIARLPRTLAAIRTAQDAFPRERGYAYWQDFVPDNSHDIRVTVIGQRAFAFRRFTRPNDFRASGSGHIDWYTAETADREAVAIAFETARKLDGDSLAFDFVVDRAKGQRLLVEMSYGYAANVVHACPGHFDGRLNWVPGHLWPQDAILEDVLARVRALRPPFR